MKILDCARLKWTVHGTDLVLSSALIKPFYETFYELIL